MANALLAEAASRWGSRRGPGDPLAVLPVLSHLLRRRGLTAERRTERLSAASLVRLAPTAVREVGRDADAPEAAVVG